MWWCQLPPLTPLSCQLTISCCRSLPADVCTPDWDSCLWRQSAHVHSLHYVCGAEVQQCSVQQVSESGSSRWTWPCTKPVQGVTSVVTTQSYSLRNTLQRHANVTHNHRVFCSVATKKLGCFSFCLRPAFQKLLLKQDSVLRRAKIVEVVSTFLETSPSKIMFL